jgi:hypothetical protein
MCDPAIERFDGWSGGERRVVPVASTSCGDFASRWLPWIDNEQRV